MRTVVITGAAGAIGRALIEALAEGPYRLGLIDVSGCAARRGRGDRQGRDDRA